MKPFKNKLAVTIVVLSVAFLGIIVLSIKGNSNIISSGVGGVISPLQKIVYTVNEKVKGSFDFFINFSNVKKENEELTAKNAELENKLIEYERMKDENTRLREMFDYSQNNANYDYLGCNIIGYSGGNISNGYIIDKGTKDGVEKDMVVITPAGLVGKVTKASSSFAIVQTILNENIAVAAMVESTDETTGILQGITDSKNKNLTELSNIPIESAIKEGDKILTSGLGEMYPKEIRIGEVISVEVDNVGIMKRAVVKPYVDFNKLEELFVVVPKEKVDIGE
ncbi:MAG: rod shape-determining protein MreC [Clostridium saudiense]|jgi:rod shape-determining protein MreC|uniref:rod shape-determining protein MreC n=1 Tax=Clostridium TaxID=1485 RepID=UPI0004B8BB60|nr:MULTISPECIES: rod shape-determining protein MreC [Clostridium]MBX9183541.1 rod shape-determining protein MreC [Clostridium sp. K04]MDU3521245.1 rod shape-determining protein MreC [Clostridium saudiense]MDU7455027.1 rod shape-determining protein MreC [Clostridium saudiense]CUO91701.1 MrECrod shape-determining protein%2C subunit C [Clostridium disporicum]SCJ97979.1 rod shape-determining protein MreC [uncultured Clostridium sp.]